MSNFNEIKAILGSIIDAWTARTHTPPILGLHSNDFDWSTKERLYNATAFGLRLIEPSLIGNGRGAETNLVLALTTGVPQGEGHWPRMPKGGPYLDTILIAKIVDWIDAGMPD